MVQGNVLGVKLRAVDGSIRLPGDLPVGSYVVTVAFPGGATIVLPDPVAVRVGQTTTLRCSDIALQCL